jgi:hypothetical protein
MNAPTIPYAARDNQVDIGEYRPQSSRKSRCNTTSSYTMQDEVYPATQAHGIAESVNTIVDTLSTLVDLVDETDIATLSNAASRIRSIELVAEARLRFALHQAHVPSPKLPNWFNADDSRLGESNPSAVKSAGVLLGALQDLKRINAEGLDFQGGPDGSVIVSFESGLRWIVYPPRLPWPGCDVRLYFPKSPDDYKLQVEQHRSADTLVESTAQHLEQNVR